MLQVPTSHVELRRRAQLVVFLAVAVACGVARADTLELISGEVVLDASVREMTDAVVRYTVGESEELQEVALIDLREIVLQRDMRSSPGPISARVWTLDGSTLEGELVDSPEGAGEGVTIESRLFAAVTIPFDALVAFRSYGRGGEVEIPGFAAEREERAEVEDVLYVLSQGTWVRVLGLLEAVTPNEVTIAWEGTSRKVPMKNVGGVILAAGGRTEATAEGLARVQLSGGSELIGVIQSYDGERLQLAKPGGLVIPVLADAVEKITFLTDRILYLADVEPAAFREAPFFDREWGYRADRNVLGGPLSLGRVRYEKGIGVHSSATLEYDLDGSYTEFSAVVGIDDEASDRGHVTFRVLLDGTEAVAHEARAGGTPERLRVPLGAASRLSLVVDYGEDGLDIGDVANWADAKLTR